MFKRNQTAQSLGRKAKFHESEAKELRRAIPIAKRDPRIPSKEIQAAKKDLKRAEAAAKSYRAEERKAKKWWR